MSKPGDSESETEQRAASSTEDDDLDARYRNPPQYYGIDAPPRDSEEDDGDA